MRRAGRGTIGLIAGLILAPGASGCSPDAQPMVVHSPIPTLDPPEGVRVREAGSGESTSRGVPYSANVHFALEGGASVEELFAHYSEELRAEGWEVEDPTVDASVGMAPLRLTGPDGRPWFGMLAVAAAAAGEEGMVFIWVRTTGPVR